MKQPNQTISLEYINPYYLLRNVLRLFWIPILLAISALLLLSSGRSILYKPEYRSSAIMAVTSKGGNSAYSSLSMTKEMTKVFAEVFQSDILKRKVAEELEIQKLDGKITTVVLPETNLLQLNVDSSSPEEAFKTLNSILNHYTEVSDYLFDNAVLETLKSPTVPISPTNSFATDSRKKLIALLAAAVGLALIVFLTVMDDSIQTASAAKDMIDGELFGIIPYENQKNKRRRKNEKNTSILITNPITQLSYIEAFQNLSTAIDHRMKKHHHQVLLISSSAENEGKSTVSANLALALSDRGKKVLLVDCDFRKPSIHKIFDLQKSVKQDLSEYLLKDNLSKKYKVTKYQNIDIALTNGNSGKAIQLVHAGTLAQFIETMRSEYDYILLDSAPMLISDTEALTSISDTSLLVVRQAFSTVGEINDCMDALNVSEGGRGYILNHYRTLGQSADEKHSAAHRKKNEKGKS